MSVTDAIRAREEAKHKKPEVKAGKAKKPEQVVEPVVVPDEIAEVELLAEITE
jgi:hypothetical protein